MHLFSLAYNSSLSCFAGWLSECIASHTAQNNTLWSNVEYFTSKYAFSYCVVCSLHTLCSLQPDNQPAKHNTVLCKLVVSLQMQNRKTTDKINEISIVPSPPNYSIVAIADQRALHLHFATDNQLAKPCSNSALRVGCPCAKLKWH